MKVLILSCSTGEGHNSAAFAVEEALKSNGFECETTDILVFRRHTSHHTSEIAYNSIIKNTPKLFGMIYKIGCIYSRTNLKSPIYAVNLSCADNLHRYIIDNNFDAVVCVHLYSMAAMAAVRKHFDNPVPAYEVLTDYTIVPFFEKSKLDGYFVPNEELKAKLTAMGINENLIYGTGIPVRSCFAEHIDKNKAREYLSVSQNKKMYLIMTGGVGCGNMSAMCDELLNSGYNDFEAYLLVGKNQETKATLDEKYKDKPQIKTVPFTREVNVYMNAADVLVTKAGGLSSTEAAVANVPLVHLMTIPGCETANADYFSEYGMAVRTTSVTEAIKSAVELAHNEEKMNAIIENQRKYINPYAADDIVEIIRKRVKK